MDIITPQLLYHGTTENTVSGFRRKLLDSTYWRPGRDFGEGFYTTISLAQARKWARKAEESSVTNAHACVLAVELISIPASADPLIFLSESPLWAEFIFSHRKVTVKGSVDPCLNHPEIIIGPMADADTGKIVKEAVLLNKDVQWFYEQIIRTASGSRRLDSLHLGSQVVFSSERWASSIRFIGYYTFVKGRWIYHEISSSSQLI
jgi:hypothetical protein